MSIQTVMNRFAAQLLAVTFAAVIACTRNESLRERLTRMTDNEIAEFLDTATPIQQHIVIDELAERGHDAVHVIPHVLLLLDAEMNNHRRMHIAECLAKIGGSNHPGVEKAIAPVRLAEALNVAACDGNLQLVRKLLDDGADVNGTYWRLIVWSGLIYGSTPLINATFSDDESLVTFLLENGANPNLKADGMTALEFAQRDGRDQVSDILMERMASSEE